MILRLFLVLWVLIAPVVGSAQEAAAVADDLLLTQDPDWERLAARAEDLAERGDASLFALNRLRSELVIWRDQFLSLSTVNEARLSTVTAQIDALGPPPEGVDEAPAIAARRAALEASLQSLMAPRLLAEEAYARANGLIGEFDAQVLQRQTRALTARGPTPLNPQHAVGGLAALLDVLRVVGVETAAWFRQQATSGELLRSLSAALLPLIVAIILLSTARRWVTNWRMQVAQRDWRYQSLMLFLLSLVQMIVPMVGLIALTTGLEALNMTGLRSGDVLEAVPLSGFVVIFAWWLSRHVFPMGPNPGYLGHDLETRAAGRRYTIAIAWVLAIAALFEAALGTMDITPGSQAAITFFGLLVLGALLWRLGRVIGRLPMVSDDGAGSRRIRRIIGRICTIVAVAGPALVALGYATGGRSVMIPWIMSLGQIGVIFVLQRIIHELSARPEKEDSDKGVFALLPVIISFALYLISMPVFALIWGARTDDLREIWNRFREGFAIGETQISPTDFLTFAIIFGIGYVLTRFVQSTLRRSVLPRTRLDLGGQNAIVAGFGYVGIILAAIIAITGAGVDLSNIALVAGALSVGIGFGLQNIVSNFVSGIILLIERPVSEGDWIEVGGQMGYVRAISVRSTRIETFDRTDVIIPNADLVSGQVTNWTRGNLVGRVIVPVGVAYGSDVQKVTKILQGIAEAHPLVIMSPPPSVLFQGFGADSLDFEIRAILRDVNYVLSTKSEMNYEIARQFEEAGVEIPFAQRDIWLRNPEVLKGESE